MGKLISITYIILILHINGFAQKVIHGNITDELTSKGVFASVVLKDEKGKIVAYSNSKKDGYFELKTSLNGIFNLQISSLSYEILSKKIVIENNSSILNYNFNLKYKFTELKEVVVGSRKPIIEKKDTIIFDAKHFLQGNEQVVEDLLKKIPGLNVLSDGTLKVGNQEVEKVMIDGDDFFEKGYRLVTKNMPISPIDKVEIYKNYSNNKLLKGIENSEKVALNLTLKEDSKRIWFGNIFGAYSLMRGNNYEYKANLMNFGKKSKHYFLTNNNNIGLDAFGDINHLIRPFRFDEPSSLGDNQSVKTLFSLNYDLPKLSSKRVNLNNSKLFSLNSIYNITKSVKLKTIGFINNNEVNFIRNSFQVFDNGNTNFTRKEDFVGNKNQITGFGKLDLIYDITKNITLEYTSKLNHANENNSSNLLFNSDSLIERLKNINQLFDQKIVYTNKFKEKKVFLLTGRYINENTPQNYSVNKFFFNNIFSENANSTIQLSESKMQFSGIEAHLLDKKDNGNLFEIKFGNQLRIDNLNSKFKLLDKNTIISLPINYQNNITYSTNDLYISANYRYNFKKFTLLNQINAHQLINQLKLIDKKLQQNPFFIVPKFGLDWKINEKHKILTSYTYNTTNIEILDIYSGYVQTGYNSFLKGIESFNQLNASSAIINYTYGSWTSNFFANTYILYSKNNTFLSTNSMISQNYTQSEKILIKDRNIISIVSNIDRYFKSIKSNIKINLSASETNSKNIVNNSNLREIKNINFNYGFEMRSSFKGFFNYLIGSKSIFNQIETTVKRSFTDNVSFIDLSFIFSDKFNIQVQSERYFFGNLNNEINKYYFLDLEARYVLKQNKLTLFLTGNNLFNTNYFRNYSISDISISQTEYKLQPRLVLFKMEYRF
jgi:hypothetical protein